MVRSKKINVNLTKSLKVSYFKENHIYQILKGLTPVEKNIGNYLLILEKG